MEPEGIADRVTDLEVEGDASVRNVAARVQFGWARGGICRACGALIGQGRVQQRRDPVTTFVILAEWKLLPGARWLRPKVCGALGIQRGALFAGSTGLATGIFKFEGSAVAQCSLLSWLHLVISEVHPPVLDNEVQRRSKVRYG